MNNILIYNIFVEFEEEFTQKTPKKQSIIHWNKLQAMYPFMLLFIETRLRYTLKTCLSLPSFDAPLSCLSDHHG